MVEGITDGRIETVVDKDTATVDIMISEMTGPSEITKVLVPIWTENRGQDDIRWYDAKKQEDAVQDCIYRKPE